MGTDCSVGFLTDRIQCQVFTPASVSNNDEMNIVLLRLVEYLGHTNPLICGVAYEEVSRLIVREG